MEKSIRVEIRKKMDVAALLWLLVSYLAICMIKTDSKNGYSSITILVS